MSDSDDTIPRLKGNVLLKSNTLGQDQPTLDFALFVWEKTIVQLIW